MPAPTRKGSRSPSSSQQAEAHDATAYDDLMKTIRCCMPCTIASKASSTNSKMQGALLPDTIKPPKASLRSSDLPQIGSGYALSTGPSRTLEEMKAQYWPQVGRPPPSADEGGTDHSLRADAGPDCRFAIHHGRCICAAAPVSAQPLANPDRHCANR